MEFAPRVLDLFCGAGGMSLGFKQAGCVILGGVESEIYPNKTHERNFTSGVIEPGRKDIRKLKPEDLGLKPGDIDILIGGPPCQGFSVVGQSKIRSLGLEAERDKKNKLYLEFVRFLRYFKPDYFVIENVPGMEYFKQQSFLTNVLTQLKRAGYVVDKRVLRATDFGVPQLRQRLFIIGRRKDRDDLNLVFPEAVFETPVSVRDAIGDLRTLHATELVTQKGSLSNGGAKHEDKPVTYRCAPNSNYQRLMRANNGDTVSNHICRGHNRHDLIIFDKLKQGQRYVDLPAKYRRYRDDIFKDKYRRLHAGRPAWTLTAHMQRDCLAYIHPTQKRSISAREAARLQSFPDDFVFEGPLTKVFHQIGNAVPPLLAQHVAMGLVSELERATMESTQSKEASSVAV